MSSSNWQRNYEQLFALLKNGERDVMVEMVEIQRPFLFDYLFRMCGQKDPVFKIIDEASQKLKDDLSFNPENLQDFRVRLFVTCRSFSSHLWNADTSELNNEAYEGEPSEFQTERFSLEEVRRVEESLAALPGWEREPVILNVRCNFSVQECALIMSIPEKSVEDSLNLAYMKIAQHSLLDPGSLEIAINCVPSHPESRLSTLGTVALSQIMGDIGDTKDRWYQNKLVWFAGVVVVGLIVFYFLN